MVEDILGFFGSAAAGGITGLLGALVSGWGELAKLKELNRHQEVMADKDRELAVLESEGKLQIARTEGEANQAVADAQALTKSYESDRATYSAGAIGKLKGWWAQVAVFALVMVDVVRGFIRPAAAAYFVGITSYLTYFAISVLLQSNDQALVTLAREQVPEILHTVLYLTVTVIAWYFGVRPRSDRRA